MRDTVHALPIVCIPVWTLQHHNIKCPQDTNSRYVLESPHAVFWIDCIIQCQ